MRLPRRRAVRLAAVGTALAAAGATCLSLGVFGTAAQATGLPQSAPRNGAITFGLSMQGLQGVDPVTGSQTQGPYLPALANLKLADPDWSPDGTKLVLVVTNADNTHGLVTYRLGDPGVTVIENPVPSGAYHPSWTRDGKAIVFQGYSGASHAGPPQLMVIDPVAGSVEKPYLPLEAPTCWDIDPQTGPGGSVVYWRPPASNCGTGVVFAANGATTAIGQAGDSSPALSPDGSTVAFVRTLPTTPSTYGIYTAPSTGGAGTPVPGSPTDSMGNLAFSPDGKELAFSAYIYGVGQQLEVMPVAGGTPVRVGYAGQGQRVSWQPVYPKNVVRLFGDSRIGTAVSSSHFMWADNGTATGVDPVRRQAKAAVISRSDNYADALGGAVLAVRAGGPLLLTPTGSLDPAVSAELDRILPAGAPVYLLGGDAALSQTVENQVGARYTVKRRSGPDRYTTAVAIAREAYALAPPAPSTPTSRPHVLVATGLDFPDALSAGTAAGALGDGVVVLTNGGSLPPATRSFLADPTGTGAPVEVDTVGGQAGNAVPYSGAVPMPSGSAVVPFSGTDRYDTSAQVAQRLFNQPPVTAGIVTGGNWPDALSGGAVLAGLHGPLLLYPPTATSPTSKSDSWLRSDAPNLRTVLIFGGTGALPSGVPSLIAGDIAGPGQSNYTENPYP